MDTTTTPPPLDPTTADLLALSTAQLAAGFVTAAAVGLVAYVTVPPARAWNDRRAARARRYRARVAVDRHIARHAREGQILGRY